MPRRDIEFKNGVGITLRGWLYTPDGVSSSERLPCLVMVHGFAAVKEMTLPTVADHFISNLKLAVLIYDNRGYGASDVGEGQPRNEVIPHDQISDFSDAISYAQSLSEVDSSKIGVWGSSFSGGHAISVAAADRRVKAVISQVPFIHGWEMVRRLVRADFMGGLEEAFAADRQARAAGQPPVMVPVVDTNPHSQSALPTADGYAFLEPWLKELPHLENKVTARSMEAMRTYIPESVIEFISPTPLFMSVAERDTLTPTDCSLKAFNKALEPKKLVMLKGGHFDAYSGENFDRSMIEQTEFLKNTLLA